MVSHFYDTVLEDPLFFKQDVALFMADYLQVQKRKKAEIRSPLYILFTENSQKKKDKMQKERLKRVVKSVLKLIVLRLI